MKKCILSITGDRKPIALLIAIMMVFLLTACGGSKDAETANTLPAADNSQETSKNDSSTEIPGPSNNFEIAENDQEVSATSSTEQIEKNNAGEQDDAEEPSENDNSASHEGIRPEFKEAMDSYEAFFDEYAEFMNEYANSDNPLSMMDEYAKFMTQYAETMADFEAMDNEEMSTEEALYYAEVSARISQKLLEAAATQ